MQAPRRRRRGVPGPVSAAVGAAWDVLVRASAATGLELHLGVVHAGANQQRKQGSTMNALLKKLREWVNRGRHPDAGRTQAVDASIQNVDANATAAAASTQSAEDATARRQRNPAEQGGEG